MSAALSGDSRGSLDDRLTGDTLTHFERMWRRIERGTPTAMARYADGEQILMEGGVIPPSSQVGIEDGWYWDGGMTRLGRDLLATLEHQEPEYFYAIPGHNDLAGAHFYTSRLRTAPAQVTFSTLFINRNYQAFRARLERLGEGVVLFGSKHGVGRPLGSLRLLEYVPMEDDCVRYWEKAHAQETARAEALARRYERTLFFIAAGPMSKPLIHAMFRANPGNRYIDVGSAMDELIRGRKTRPYMHADTVYAAHVSRFDGRAEPPPATPPAPMPLAAPQATPAPQPAWPLPTVPPGRAPADVTVVLNTYKRPHTLRRQYDAVIAQTCPPAEIFVWQNCPGPHRGVEVQPGDFDGEVLARCITATSANTNFGVWGRFAFALNARTTYVCMLDDDTIPGRRWIENCLQTMATHRGLLGTVGIVQHGPDHFGQHHRVGWCAPNRDVTVVDYVGHAWFFEREWLSTFWRELPSRDWFAYEDEPHALCAGEDIHFSYTLQKYLGLRTYVPPHPADDRSLWGSDPELAMKYGTDAAAVSNLRGPHFKLDVAWAHYRAKGFRLLCEG
ncbi:MAG: glycosyltransferase family 2 protein [Vicinamibacterales bacterium]